MNKEIFFGQYKRIGSYFEGTDLAATGLPSSAELELLEPYRENRFHADKGNSGLRSRSDVSGLRPMPHGASRAC